MQGLTKTSRAGMSASSILGARVARVLAQHEWDSPSLRMVARIATPQSQQKRALQDAISEIQRLRFIIDGSQPEPNFQVLVVHVPYGNLRLNVAGSDTVLQVKERIRATTGFSLDMMRLYRGGSVLDDNRKLEDYKIRGSATLHLRREPHPRLVKVTIHHAGLRSDKLTTMHVEDTKTICGVKWLFEDAMMVSVNPNYNTLSKRARQDDRLSYFSVDSARFFSSSNGGRPLDDNITMQALAGTDDEVSLYFIPKLFCGIAGRINIVAQGGRSVTLGVRMFDTIADVKKKVEEHFGIRSEYQQLAYIGQPMQDDLTLAFYRVQNEATFRLA